MTKNGKYHDQSLIVGMVKQIRMNKDYASIVEFMKDELKLAKNDVDAINAYTAPEERNRRIQSLYYYEDILTVLNELEEGERQ